MRLEILIQFIVPLTFLAIWALTSLLNRDSQPLPPRPGRPQGGPGGTRPAPASRGPGRPELRPPTTPLPPRSPASGSPSVQEGLAARSRPGAIPSPRDRQRTRQTQDIGDAIVYIEDGVGARGGSRGGLGLTPDTIPAGSRASRSSPSRRGQRGRSVGNQAPATQGPGEPDSPRALSEIVSQSLALRKAKPLELTPLSAPIVGLSRSLSEASATAELPRRTDPEGIPTLRGEEIRGLLASTGKIREVVLLNEVLLPPLALRGHPRRP